MLRRSPIKTKLIAALLILFCWWLTAVCWPGFLFPGPLETLAAAFGIVASAGVRDVLITLLRTLNAFVISLALALLVALTGQYNRQLEDVVKELMSFLIRIPSIASITFFVLLFGTGPLTIYVSVACVVIPVTVLSISGLYEKLNPDLHTISRVYRVPYYRKVFYFYLPALFGAFQPIFILSYSLTFKALIMAEFLGGLSGLGYGLMIQRETLDLDRLTAYILLIALAGFCSQKLLELGMRWCTRRYAPV